MRYAVKGTDGMGKDTGGTVKSPQMYKTQA